MVTAGLSVEEACRLLKLDAPAAGDALSAAFRRAAKATHPDRDGGDAERFCLVLEAYHLLQRHGLAAPDRAPIMPRPLRALPSWLVITPLQAMFGAGVRLEANGAGLLVRVPPGVRSGDHVHLPGYAAPMNRIPVLIRPADGICVLNGDLFITARVPHRYLRDGGRIEIDTPLGPKAAWLVPDMVEPVRLCFRGQGLPARGKRPAGDLFVKLEGNEDMSSAAEDMLERFTRLWTAQAAAA